MFHCHVELPARSSTPEPVRPTKAAAKPTLKGKFCNQCLFLGGGKQSRVVYFGYQVCCYAKPLSSQKPEKQHRTSAPDIVLQRVTNVTYAEVLVQVLQSWPCLLTEVIPNNASPNHSWSPTSLILLIQFYSICPIDAIVESLFRHSFTREFNGRLPRLPHPGLSLSYPKIS